MTGRDKEIAFFMALIRRASEILSDRICDDLEGPELDAFNRLTMDERDNLSRAYSEWNGDPEEWEPGMHHLGMTGPWLAFMASRLVEAAKHPDG